MRTQVARAICLATLLSAILTSCADTGPTTSDQSQGRIHPSAVRPQLLVTPMEAEATADSYVPQDPLGPFGGDYYGFFENPESVTDGQFLGQAPYSILEGQVPQIETDAENIEAYCASSGGGGGGGIEPPVYVTDQNEGTGDGSIAATSSSSDCAMKYTRCLQRCGRLASWDRRARALCWSGCMAAYALCIRRARGG